MNEHKPPRVMQVVNSVAYFYMAAAGAYQVVHGDRGFGILVCVLVILGRLQWPDRFWF